MAMGDSRLSDPPPPAAEASPSPAADAAVQEGAAIEDGHARSRIEKEPML